MKTKELQNKIDSFTNKYFLWAIPNSVLPNYLTFARFVSIPVIYFLLTKDLVVPAFVLFFVSAFTDLLDGAMARTRNQVSDLGKILDPIADKGIVIVVLLFFGYQYFIVKLFVIIVMIEVVANLIAGLFAKYIGRPVGANFFGKIKMVFQCISIAFLFVGMIVKSEFTLTLAQYFLYMALFFALLSGLEITLDGIKKHFHTKFELLD